MKKFLNVLKIILLIVVPVVVYFIWIANTRVAGMNSDVQYARNNDGTGFIYTVNTGYSILGIEISDEGVTEKIKEISGNLPEDYAARDLLTDSAGAEIVAAESFRYGGNYVSLIKTDDQLSVTGTTPEYSIDEGFKVMHVTDEGDFYAVTAVNDLLNQAKAYIVSKEALNDTEDAQPEDPFGPVTETIEKAQVISATYASANEYIADAVYHDGIFRVRHDTDPPQVWQGYDEAAIEHFISMHLSTFQKFVGLGNRAKLGLAVVLIVIAVFLFVFVFVVKKSRMIATIITAATLIILTAFLAWFSTMAFEYGFVNTSENAYESRSIVISNTLYAPLSEIDDDKFDDLFYKSDQYSYLRYVCMNAPEAIISDAGIRTYYTAVVRASDDFIIVSSNCKNRGSERLVFGNTYDSIKKQLPDAEGAVCEDILFNGDIYTLCGYDITDSWNGDSIYLISLFDNPTSDEANDLLLRSIMLWVRIIGLLAIFLFLYVILRDKGEIDSIRDAIVTLSEGDTEYKTPRKIPSDRQTIWAGLSEIAKRIKGSRYTKESIYKAYYRFAPKNIENYLRKGAITDVHSGDQSRVEGTLAIFSLEVSEDIRKSGDLTKAGEFISYMNENGGSGMIVSSDCDLSRIDMLFDGTKKNTVELGTSLILDMEKHTGGRKMSLFLYHSLFFFGVTGTNDQALTYLISDDTKIYEEFGQWFASLSIELVITEDVREREQSRAAVRYIGFIELSGGRTERLYEVLDATDAAERLAKLRFAEKFEETLKLFYSKDYYLARNEFSKILQQQPDDELCRWYLFECEKCLNSGAKAASYTGALHTS